MKKAVCSAAAGFLAAAAFPTLVLSVSMPFGLVYVDYDLESVLMSSVVYFPFALVDVVVLGIPTLLLLYPFRPGRWWMPVVAGLILGVPLFLTLPGDPTLAGALIFMPLSALTALVFWRVWRWVGEREGVCGAC